MEIIFSNKNIQKLYETGKSNKYMLRENIIKDFYKVIAILEASKDIYDLFKTSSLHFEKLKNSKNEYSARLNKKWRLEFCITWIDEKNTIGIIYIKEISNHYGD